MQQPRQSQPGEYGNLAAIQRQLDRMEERLEERTKNIATRQDLEALRKEVVSRDFLESQQTLLRDQIRRLEQDRTNDREEMEKRFDALKTEQASKAERFWQRLSPIIAAIALLIALLQFLTHVRLTP